MNLTNDPREHDNDESSSSDDDDNDENKTFDSPPSILVEHFFCDNNEELGDDSSSDNNDDDDDDDDDADDDIENRHCPKIRMVTHNHLCSMLRQSNRLVELKLNMLQDRFLHSQQQQQVQYPSLRHALSDSDMTKRSPPGTLFASLSSNNFLVHTSQSHRRLYLSSTYITELQFNITDWLQASLDLINSISTSIQYRRCWPQLLLTYFIEQHLVDLQFLICSSSLSSTIDEEFCINNRHGCIPEEDAYKLSATLQKGARLNIHSTTFDHIRRIIIIKTMQETSDNNVNIQQLYVKQLKCLKQSLNYQQQSSATINLASIYSKLLLFLSNLYSIKAETMQTLFCQHLIHNPTYSFLVVS